MAAYCIGHMETGDLLRATGADIYPAEALFCNIWCGSEPRSLVQNAIVELSDVDRRILHVAAIQYSKMGQTSSSEEMGLLALEKAKIILGGQHPDTLEYCQFLARLFTSHNDYGNAEAMARRALDSMLAVMDPRHPSLLQVSVSLARILEKQGKLEEAKGFASQALHAMSKTMGPEHPRTLQAFNTLIEMLERHCKSEEAKKVKRDFGVEIFNRQPSRPY